MTQQKKKEIVEEKSKVNNLQSIETTRLNMGEELREIREKEQGE